MAESTEDAVIAIYDAWRNAFQQVDADKMKSLFDRDYAGLVYQAEEMPTPFYSWPEIDEYWSAAPAIVAKIPEWRELTRKIAMDGNAAYVYSKLQTHIEVNGANQPLVGELRVSMGLHQTAGGWRIVHYHESRHVDISFLFEE